MFDKAENYLSEGNQADIDAFVRAGNSADNAAQSSPIPIDPRIKCIQWSASDLLETGSLKIIAMTGDFSAFCVSNSQASFKQESITAQLREVFELLRETQLKEIRDQFETAIRKGKSPEKLELKLYSGDNLFWVEQETIIQKTPTDKLEIFTFWYDITAQKLVEKDQRVLRQVVDEIPSWIFLKNTNHQYELVNKAYAASYGVSPEECIGKTCVELGVPQAIAEKFWEDDCDVFESGQHKDIFAEPIVIDGKLRYLNTHKSPVKDLENGQELLIGYCHDITYQKQIEEQIGIELSYSKILNEVHQLLHADSNSHQSLVEIGELLVQETGCADVQIQLDLNDQPISKLEPGLCLYSVAIALNGAQNASLNVWHNANEPVNEGTKKLLTTVAKKLAVAFHQQELLEKINHQANFDSLTGLPNRHNILGMIDDAIDAAKQNGSSCAVMFIDLDGFKTINDTFGHQVGDKMLTAAAQRLQSIATTDETVARLGGDEFAILVTNVNSSESTVERAEKYLESLGKSFDIDGRDLRVGGSLGISFFPKDSDGLETIVQHADWAMYMAKSQGRNTCQPFTAQIAKLTQHRISLENDLSEAIEKNKDLFVEFQPKIDMRSKRVIGVEALTRWSHPTHGLVSPTEFIPIAEKTGQIIRLGELIMRDAFQTVANWNRQLDQKIVLSLNITPPELEQRGLVDHIIQTLEETGLDPNCLDLELTETFVMKRFDEVSRRLKKLREYGIKISIDDFGTGYSCMSYLHRLPVDCLKIDASFIGLLDFDSRAKNSKRTSLTETIVTLAKSMGLKTVAEGIETENQYQHLLELGVDCGQGFWFSQALPNQEALAFVQQQNGEF